MVTQLAGEAGAYVIGTGRAGTRQSALDLGAQEFLDLDDDTLEADEDLYPDEVLSDIAESLGFGQQFDDVVGLERA